MQRPGRASNRRSRTYWLTQVSKRCSTALPTAPHAGHLAMLNPLRYPFEGMWAVRGHSQYQPWRRGKVPSLDCEPPVPRFYDRSHGRATSPSSKVAPSFISVPAAVAWVCSKFPNASFISCLPKSLECKGAWLLPCIPNARPGGEFSTGEVAIVERYENPK